MVRNGVEKVLSRIASPGTGHVVPGSRSICDRYQSKPEANSLPDFPMFHTGHSIPGSRLFRDRYEASISDWFLFFFSVHKPSPESAILSSTISRAPFSISSSKRLCPIHKSLELHLHSSSSPIHEPLPPSPLRLAPPSTSSRTRSFVTSFFSDHRSAATPSSPASSSSAFLSPSEATVEDPETTIASHLQFFSPPFNSLIHHSPRSVLAVSAPYHPPVNLAVSFASLAGIRRRSTPESASGEDDPEGDPDPTRPEQDPRPLPLLQLRGDTWRAKTKSVLV